MELVVFKEPARFLVFLSRVQVPGRITYPILGKRKIIVKVPLGVDRKVSRRVNLDLWGTYFQIQQITIDGEKGQATYCFPLWQRIFLPVKHGNSSHVSHPKIHFRNQKIIRFLSHRHLKGGTSYFRFPRSTPYEVSLTSRFFLCRKAYQANLCGHFAEQQIQFTWKRNGLPNETTDTTDGWGSRSRATKKKKKPGDIPLSYPGCL